MVPMRAQKRKEATNEPQGRARLSERAAAGPIQVAKSNFRNGGANLPVCRDDPQVVAHYFGNFFWQSLYTRRKNHPMERLAPECQRRGRRWPRPRRARSPIPSRSVTIQLDWVDG